MTETEWEQSNNPIALMGHLRTSAAGWKGKWFARQDECVERQWRLLREVFDRFSQLRRWRLETPWDYQGFPVAGSFHGMEAYTPIDALTKSQLIRDIFGNPFRKTKIDPNWLLWNGGVVSSLARSMHDAGDFTDMPILADALEEAGCDDPLILSHCRASALHVRGCWVIDLLLDLR